MDRSSGVVNYVGYQLDININIIHCFVHSSSAT